MSIGGFFKDWKDAIVGFGGAIQHGFGAALDWATSTPPSYDPATGRQAPGEFDKMMLDVSKSFNGMYKGLGPVGKSASWLMEKDYELYSNWISRPTATGITIASLMDSPTWQSQQHKGQLGALFDRDTWTRAHQIALHRSPGQAFALMGTDDILNQHEVEDTQRAWWFTLLSGSFDAVWSMRFDPFGAAGKAVKRTGVLRTTKPLPTTLTEMGQSKEVRSATKATEEAAPDPSGIQRLVEGTPPGHPATETIGKRPVYPRSPMVRTLDWMQKVSDRAKSPGEAARVIEKHPILAASPHSGLIASMMADSTRGDKDLIMRIAMGDGSAYDALRASRDDLAKRLEQLEDVRPDLAKAEFSAGKTPTDKAFDPERVATVKREIEALDRREGWMHDLIDQEASDKPGVYSSVGVQAKGLGYDRIAAAGATARGTVATWAARGNVKEATRYYNQFNTPVRVISGLGLATAGKAAHFVNGVKPRGWLDPNDPEGWRELDHMLSRVKGFSVDRRNEIVGNYMLSTSDVDKLRIANNAEREAIGHVMHKIGLKAEDANEVVDQHIAQRDKALGLLANRAYSATKDPTTGDRIDLQFVDSENIPTAILPVLRTQLAEKIPLADMDTIQKAAFRHQENLHGYFAAKAGPVKDFGVGLGDIFASTWKTATLMRLGYMVRVLGDDELAYVAKVGAMTALKPLLGGQGPFNWAYNRWATNAIRVQRAAMRARKLAPGGPAKLQTKPGAGVAPPEGEAELPEYQPKRRIGQASQDYEVGGPELPESLLGVVGARIRGKKYDATPGTKVTLQGVTPQTTKGRYWDGLFEGDRTRMQEDANYRLRRSRKEFAKPYGLVNRGSANYYQAWTHALNFQLGQDEIGRKLLKGEDPEDVIQWLRRTPEGRAHKRTFKLRASDEDRWVHNVHAFIEDLAPNEELRTAARNGNVTEKLIKDSVTNAEHPDQIAGALLDFNMGRGEIADQFVRIRDGFYRRANQMPTHVLAKHPLAKNIYDRKVRELVERHASSGGELTNPILRKLENQARSITLKEINKVVLDLSTHSNAAHLLRFIAPFYNAWDKALRRWGRMAYGDPSIIFRGNRIWQGLSNMPVLFDRQQGHVEDAEGNRLTGYRGLSGAGEQFLTFRLPATLAKKLGLQDFPVARIAAGNLNLVLQGNQWYLPGFGPFVQIPASKFVESKPKYADMLKSILPYGPQNTGDLITPTSLRKFGTWRNKENEEYQKAMINIWRTRWTQWNTTGRHGPEPSPLDPQIAKDAGHLLKMQFYTQVFSPFNVRYSTPYKFYIDAYHKILTNPPLDPETGQKMDPQTAFMQKYPDYFLFAQSVSKNNAQLPSSTDAWLASKKYRSLLAQAPDVAPAVLGDMASLDGAFNSAVYQAQFKQRLSPASLTTAREPQSAQEFAQSAMASKGWNRYNKLMEILRIELSNRHLLSFAQSGAQDLKVYKEAIVKTIAKENPAWYNDYQSYDAEKTSRVIDQLHKVASMKPLQGRTDIQTLQQYLLIRDVVMQELAHRKQAGGSGSILAQTNGDLARAWDFERDRVADGDTTFSRNIFDRFLHGDSILVAGPNAA